MKPYAIIGLAIKEIHTRGVSANFDGLHRWIPTSNHTALPMWGRDSTLREAAHINRGQSD